MDITVDGSSKDYSCSDQETLSTIVENIDDELRERGYRVGTITLDGHELDQNWAKQVGDKEAEGFDHLEVETVAPRELSLETLTELREHFDKLLDPLNDITSQLQQGQIKTGFETMQTIMNHLQTFIQTINHIVVISDLDLTQISMNEKNLQEYVEETADLIIELEPAIKEEDLVTVSDTCEYELRPLIEDWVDICSKLQNIIKDKWDEPEEI